MLKTTSNTKKKLKKKKPHSQVTTVGFDLLDLPMCIMYV